MKFIHPLVACAIVALSYPLHAEELHVRGDRLFVPVEIHGRTVEAVLDSGAEVTVLDQGFAAELPLGEGKEVSARGTGEGPVTAQLVENLPLRALGRDMRVPVAAVLDLGDVGERLFGGRLDVILGREIFDTGVLAIDVESGTIEWLGQGNVPAGTRLELTATGGIEAIPVRFGDITALAEFDLGNGTGLLVSPDLVGRLGLAPAGVEPGGGIGGSKGRLVVVIPALDIAGYEFRNVRAHVDNRLEVDANIGVASLRAFRIVTDFPGRAIWLEARE